MILTSWNSLPGPLSDTREGVPKISLGDFPRHLSFVKETESEKAFRA